MRILQVISHYVPAYGFGGPLQVAHGLGRALVGHGHEVTVCCTNQRDPRVNLDVPLDRPVDVDGVKVFYEPVSPALRYWGYSGALRRRVAHEAKHADLVISHFHYQYASYVGGWAARRAGRPLVIFAHGSLNRHGVKARSRYGKRCYLGLLERRNFAAAVRVVYHSEGEWDNSVQLGRPCILPIGLDPREIDAAPPRGEFRRTRGRPEDEFVFVYIGRLAPGKGLELLLPAFAEAARGVPAHLVLVGGDERGFGTTLRAQVEQLGLAGRVTFTGLLLGREKVAALRDADAFVLPSRSEGLSLATMEAMYAGLPVLVTDRVGLSVEVARRRCGLVVPYDPAALREALGEMMKRNDRVEMGARGRAAVLARYTWDLIAASFLTMANEVIAGRAARPSA